MQAMQSEDIATMTATETATETFGACLKRLMREREVRGAGLARALAVDSTLVSHWLNDKRTPALNSGYAERIAEYLELSQRQRNDLSAAQVRSRRTAPKLGGRGDPKRGTPGMRVIRGQLALNLAILKVLEDLKAPRPGDDTLTFTMHATAAADTVDHAILARYPAALRRAMGLGWRVRELWRLDDDPIRSATLVAHLLDLAAAGRYEPRSFAPYGPLAAAQDLVVVPGRACFQLFATHGVRAVDGALLATDRDGMALLRDHAELLARQTTLLFERYPIVRRGAFSGVLAAAEELPGGRMLVKYGFSVYTEPEDWSREDSHWARRMARMGADVGPLLAARVRRQEAFRRNVQVFQYRDICPVSAVRRLVMEGAYVRDDVPEDFEPADPAARAEHLRHAIAVLERHDNYQLALIDDAEAARFGIRPETYWSAVGGSRAMVDVRAPDESGRVSDTDLDITEPTIAAGFAHHFDSIWARIAPRNRDKACVVGWLRQQLAQLDVY